MGWYLSSASCRPVIDNTFSISPQTRENSKIYDINWNEVLAHLDWPAGWVTLVLGRLPSLVTQGVLSWSHKASTDCRYRGVGRGATPRVHALKIDEINFHFLTEWQKFVLMNFYRAKSLLTMATQWRNTPWLQTMVTSSSFRGSQQEGTRFSVMNQNLWFFFSMDCYVRPLTGSQICQMRVLPSSWPTLGLMCGLVMFEGIHMVSSISTILCIQIYFGNLGKLV